MRNSANDAFFTAESLENLSEAPVRESIQNSLDAAQRSDGNKETEVAVARLLRANRISGWRKQREVRILFPKARLAVFVDGCFWHGCPRHATRPKNNASFWRRKLAANKKRDQLVNRALRQAGWRVVRIWECALQKKPAAYLKRILSALD
jgi:DNA mismatch endonuclease, patch repair protein